MPTRSVHHNRVYAYTVACEQGKITLHTSHGSAENEGYLDVIFSGVVAHYFQHVLQSNLLLGIEKKDPERIVTEWADLFAVEKEAGWPGIEYEKPDDLIARLKFRGARGFHISAAHGLGGWVLATSMELQARHTKFMT